ncbi:MAG: hypothetical protein K8R35_06885 [Bacteroidales bacterium]|nr:hypothetical protein [Bacteroidales bacterium]
MDFFLFTRRITLLVSNPVKFWESVKKENLSVGEIRSSFILPLIILIGISSFTGIYIFKHSGLSVVYPLIIGSGYSLIFFVSIEIATLIISEISIAFTSDKNHNTFYKLVVYSFTPYMVIIIVTRLFSSLLFANIFGLYGLLILWKGLAVLTKSDQATQVKLTALISITTVVFYLGIRWIILILLEGFYFMIYS